jgi:hypothetical protein
MTRLTMSGDVPADAGDTDDGASMGALARCSDFPAPSALSERTSSCQFLLVYHELSSCKGPHGFLALDRFGGKLCAESRFPGEPYDQLMLLFDDPQ